MKTLTVHPAVMKRILQGNLQPITTRYELEPGEDVEVISDDEVNSVTTRIHSVQRKGEALFLIELEDPATAFRKEVPDGD